MREEVFFDLDTNNELEGSYFHCNSRLINSVFALLENGYDVIDCKLSDTNHIYLRESDVTVNNKSDHDIIQEGKENNEYRRITYKGEDCLKYDCFCPDDTIEIRLLGKYEFSNLPEGFNIYSFDNCTIIRIKIKIIEYEDKMYGYPRKLKGLDVFSALKNLESWIESLTGKQIEYVQTDKIVQNNYGNSEFAIDMVTKQIKTGNYILLDSLMIPIIRELRQKGYKTLGCCSGHFDSVFTQNTGIIPEGEFIEKKVESWIVFSNEFDVPTPPEDAQCSEVGNFYRISYSNSLLNSDGTYKSVSIVKTEIEESIFKLLEWSKSLPYANDFKCNK